MYIFFYQTCTTYEFCPLGAVCTILPVVVEPSEVCAHLLVACQVLALRSPRCRSAVMPLRLSSPRRTVPCSSDGNPGAFPHTAPQTVSGVDHRGTACFASLLSCPDLKVQDRVAG